MSARHSIWTRARNRWSPDRWTWADHAAEKHRAVQTYRLTPLGILHTLIGLTVRPKDA